MHQKHNSNIPFGSLFSNFGARASDFRQLLDSEWANRFSESNGTIRNTIYDM